MFNLGWALLGGWLAALAWALAGMMARAQSGDTPEAETAQAISRYCLAPKGKALVPAETLFGDAEDGLDSPDRPPAQAAGLAWAAAAPVLAMVHLCAAGLSFVTIIGIQYAIMHMALLPRCWRPGHHALAEEAVVEELTRAESVGEAPEPFRTVLEQVEREEEAGAPPVLPPDR